jgi:L-alanine-DL-glutamate epimerase-like enolase superfamily enzyme
LSIVAHVKQLEVTAYEIPTDRPESDGTISWDSTTVVVVEVASDSGHRGLGYTYASRASATLIREKLAKIVVGGEVERVRENWQRMVDSVRNVGRPGIAAMGISTVDVALWDLLARSREQPLLTLLGVRRLEVPIYGSGGFTSYTVEHLQEQLSGWVHQGIPRVKMKIGSDWGSRPDDDVARVKAARQAIGPKTELFVDANGAYNPKQAVIQAERFAEHGVSYFEEPVSSDHLDQLRFVKEHTSMDIAAGEYAFDPWYVRDMLQAGAVDIQQADVTRCLGITGWLQAADIAHGFAVRFSAHCAPAISGVVGCAVPQISHIEYFHDHARIESMIFDGALQPVDGCLRPDPGRPGLGLELKRSDADKFRVS